MHINPYLSFSSCIIKKLSYTSIPSEWATYDRALLLAAFKIVAAM